MYKWITFTEDSPVSIIDQLKKKYNTPHKEYYFKESVYDGKHCIEIISDLTVTSYGEPVPSNRFKATGDIFFPPAHEVSHEPLEVCPKHRDGKIKVLTVSNKTLWIIPASMEPKALVFSFGDNEILQEKTEPYSLVTDYGRTAYSIFSRIERKEEVTRDDSEVMKLIMLGMAKSYDIPLDLLNHMNLLSTQDIDKLLVSCLGIDSELLKKNNSGLMESEIPTPVA